MASIDFFMLGLGAWIGALVAPPLFAVWFWNKAPRHVGRWPAHLMFAPMLLLVEWLLVRALFFAAHDDGEGPPGLGFALIPQALLLMGTLAVYYFRVAWKGVETLWQAINQH